MTAAIITSIALIDEILKACDDVSTFETSAAKVAGGGTFPTEAEGAPKQGKKEKKKKPAKQAEITPANDPATQDPMASADLRVATIIAVEPVQNSEKLWKCQVNVGDEQPRQIIAGLQPYISKDVMEGLSAVVICNLKPAKLAGEVSEAMLLAATSTADSSIVRTLQPPEGCKPGDKVFAGDSAGTPAKVMKSKPWASVIDRLKAEGGKPAYAGVPLATHLGPCSVPSEIPDGSSIR